MGSQGTGRIVPRATCHVPRCHVHTCRVPGATCDVRRATCHVHTCDVPGATCHVRRATVPRAHVRRARCHGATCPRATCHGASPCEGGLRPATGGIVARVHVARRTSHVILVRAKL